VDRTINAKVVSYLMSVALLCALGVRANAQQPPLARLQFDIVGIRLVVDPPALTVPKNIATHINTSLVVPPSAGTDVRDALAALTAGAVVEAELRGPLIPPTRITAVPGQPIPIPAFALPGDYFLDGIRLVKNGQTILDATAPDGRPASTIPIRVISEVFVTGVTSRPLSLDEIREKGIVIDQSSFQAVNFQIAFNIDGRPFTINMPSVLPTPQLLSTTVDRTSIIRQVAAINRSLAATQTTLPPEFDRPGINFSIAALPFMFVPEDGGIPSLSVPPVNGLVVIAGNVAFLNQFFKVAVMVTNVAPDGSLLQLRDVTGTVVLPAGLDRVAGTPEAPGDDPLRLARTESAGTQRTVPIIQPGSDGIIGTADDIAVIPPQRQAEGEFLLEGLKEGGHTFDVEISAVLDGLPSGPVRMTGLAAGAVFVRNPTFAVTLAHPRTIRSGEAYNLYATVTNTSRSVANLVSVNLDPLSISGAELLSEPAITFETIAAGQSATARFRLRAQQTGEVTFTSFTGDAAQGGGVRLFTGVGERNVALAPNSIVLPKTTDALPPGLVAAAQRVLGQAFSIATAPAEGLPPDVLFVKRQTVIDRGLELAQAGERVQFGESPGRVAQDLLLDWSGNTVLDAGFDQILRTTEAGAAFLAELAAILGPVSLEGGVLTGQQIFARGAAARARPHVSAVASGGTAPPALTITRADGTAVSRGAPGTVTMPGAALLPITGGAASGLLGVLSVVEPLRHTFEIVASDAATYDLGIVIPGSAPGTLQQVRYSGVPLAAGGVARVSIDLAAPGILTLQVDANGDGVTDATRVPQVLALAEAPPQVLAVRQLQSSFRDGPGDPADPATYGLLLGVLFDKPVTRASSELKSSYAIDSNAVIGARLQQSGRLVYLYLQQPVGGLTPRSIAISGIQDVRGGILPASTTPIAMTLTDGGRVFGQVQEAGGQPVPGAVLRLTVVVEPRTSFDVATIQVDSNGSFDFDFVPRVGLHFILTAQHPVTRDLTTLTARLRGAGEQLLLNPTFTGRGTVRGRLLAADGVTIVPDVPIALIPGGVLGSRGFAGRTNAVGEFVFTDVPVGIFTLTASDGVRGFGQVQGLIARAGVAIVQDVVLVTQPEEGGRLVGRVFLGDGVTPASAFVVYAGQYNRNDATIAAVDTATTDSTGSFAFARVLPAATYDVVAVDPASQQIGTTTASLIARLTTSVSVVLEATGTVEGVVFNAQGQPVPGAVIAGGLALGTADANGFFRIDGVPAGARTIEAGDPVTRRRGSARVSVVPGQTVRVSIPLEARATITGRVLDANGTPMPRVSVRLPVQGGYTFVFTNNQGVFTFPNLTLGSHLIQAPGPSVDSLISFLESNGYDLSTAFTSGDAPPSSGGGPPSAGDANAVLAAYQQAVRTFLSVDESILGLPIAGLGGFGWNRAELFQDSTTVVADVRFLGQGQVEGRTEDATGRPTGAVVRVLGLSVSLAGSPALAELGRMNSDAATGAFAFTGIPRFDLTTFQATGIRGGDFTLEAAQPFSPTVIAHRAQLNTSTPNLIEVVMRFPAASETNGTVSGQVFLPDGVTPAPPNTQVRIGFGDLTVLTGANGRFTSLLPFPAGTYTITATAPNGLRAQALAAVPAGGRADVQIRLLGLGRASIVVRRPNGVPVANALVRLERATFPNDRADARTDGTGAVNFVNLTEGPVAIVAEEELTGLTGRASGLIVREVSVTIPLTITASGRVTGRFLTADGSQALPSAQIVLTTGAVQAYGSTDAAGRFELLSVPVGRFTVEARDALTGRLGRTTGELVFEGQTVDVTVLQLPRGTVSGVVLNADGVTPVPAARVRISGDGAIRTELQATARADGGFRFEGVPEGTFAIEATDVLTEFKGTATGRIAAEGELVDVNVTLEPFGAVDVTVLDAPGQPAGNATLTIAGPGGTRTAAVDAAGRFAFEHLRLGTYRVVARSLSDPGDAGGGQATLATANQRVESTVRLRGTGRVTVSVVAADGTTPVASARVTLEARGAFAGEQPGPAAATLNGFTDAAGRVTLANVSIGEFFARGEAAALGGVVPGTLAAPGETASATVRLGASGTVSGRVLLPGGTTPAAQAIVTLRFQSQSQLQSGVLQVTTGVDGTFAFSGIPLGTFTLSAFELVSSGVRNADGSLGVNGEQAALGDLVLDNAGPRVLSVDPANGSLGAAPGAAVAITFNEAVQPGTLRTGAGTASNIVLLLGNTAVPLVAPVLSNGNRTVTLRAAQPLVSAAQYTLSIRGGPDGPQDEAGLSLADAFVSTFTVRDVVAPAIVSAFPAPDAQGVLPEAAIRIAVSEPIAAGTLTLRTAAGALVPGVTALTAGNRAIVFSPQSFLLPNTSYTVTLANVTDLAGNPLAGGSFVSRFFTVDTLGPVISALQIAGAARAGATVAVQAIVPASDTARVEFRTSEGLARTATAAPFAVNFTLPADRASTTISAVAVDHAGNRSPVFDRPVTILEDARPLVFLSGMPGVTEVRQGQLLAFEARADDDVELAQLLFSTVGAAVSSAAQAVPAGQATFTSTFNVEVPAGAVSGQTLTVQAASVDRLGQQSAPVSRVFTVRDGIRPAVTILTPVNNAQVLAGQNLSVMFDATDDVAVASVALICNPALAGCETRPLATPATTTRQSFTIQVPANLQAPDSMSLLISVTDTSGNITQAGRTLRLVDTAAPVVTTLESASGSTRVAAGDLARLRASVNDNVGVTALLFDISGAHTASGTVPVTPALTSGAVPLVFAVPSGIASGALISVRVRARDAAGNTGGDTSLALTVGDGAPPVLELLAPADGAQVSPGQRITMRVRATVDVAISRVVFEASEALSRTLTFTPPLASTPLDASFDVDVPAGTAAGVLTLSARAFDAGGNPSNTVVRQVNILDVVAPSVRIVSPVNGAAIDPRTPLQVVVEATDQVGVTGVTFGASGVVAASESRPRPAAPTASETFTVAFVAVPSRGGSVSFSVSARDAAGNVGAATTVTVQITDVVAPDIASTTPASGATGVDPAAAIVVRFTERMDRTSLNGAAVQLRRGPAAVPATIGIDAADEQVTLTPAQPLAPNALHSIVVTTAARDAGGNALAGDRTFTFRTASPDTEAPRVIAIAPADGTVNAALTSTIDVTFTEPVEPATVTEGSFRVAVNGAPLPGARTLLNANRIARFVPAEPLPTGAFVVVELTSAIADPFGNALADPTGSPLTTPLTFTFVTASFGLTSPAGTEVVEDTAILLEARASNTSGIASVVFSVNGVSFPAVAGPVFSRPFTVPSASAVSSLIIVASARDSQGAEVARDERTLAVIVGLKVTPPLFGVPVGGTSLVRFTVSSPLQTDLAIALRGGNPSLVTFPVNPVILPAGQTAVEAAVAGIASGNTALFGDSDRGTAAAIMSVSAIVPGSRLEPFATPIGVALSNPASAGLVVLAASATQTMTVRLLDQPAAAALPVSVTSTNVAVATADPGTVLAGQQAVNLQVTTLADGIATLIVRVGAVVRSITVIVGTPPANMIPLTLAPSAGLAISNPATVGQLFANPGSSATTTVVLLSSAAASAMPVTVRSSDPSIATATVSAIAAGEQTANVTVTAVSEGTATLIFTIGSQVRSLTVFVGTPPADRRPLLLAAPVGASVIGLTYVGQAIAAPGTVRSLGIRLLESPAAQDVVVSVFSSNPSVASVAGPVTVRAGEVIAEIALQTGIAGTAVLRLEVGSVRREFVIVVSTDPSAPNTPPVVAAPAGAVVIPNPMTGRIFAPPGAPVVSALGITLLTAPRAAPLAVSVTSSNSSIVSFGAASTVTVEIAPGRTVADIVVTTTGVEGAAVLTFEFEGQRKELLIVVGNPPASQIPAVVAPVVGVRKEG